MVSIFLAALVDCVRTVMVGLLLGFCVRIALLLLGSHGFCLVLFGDTTNQLLPPLYTLTLLVSRTFFQVGRQSLFDKVSLKQVFGSNILWITYEPFGCFSVIFHHVVPNPFHGILDGVWIIIRFYFFLGICGAGGGSPQTLGGCFHRTCVLNLYGFVPIWAGFRRQAANLPVGEQTQGEEATDGAHTILGG